MSALDWINQRIIQPGEAELGSATSAAKNTVLNRIQGAETGAGNSLNAARNSISNFNHGNTGWQLRAQDYLNKTIVPPITDFGNAAGRSIATLFAPTYEGVSTADRGATQAAQNQFITQGKTNSATNIGQFTGQAAPYFVNAPLAVGSQLGNQLGRYSEGNGLQNNLGSAAKDVGLGAVNLVPGLPAAKYTAGLSPLLKYGANAGIAGAENVLRGQGSSLIETGRPDTNIASNALQFGVGSGLHTVLHPGESLAAAGSVIKGGRNYASNVAYQDNISEAAAKLYAKAEETDTTNRSKAGKFSTPQDAGNTERTYSESQFDRSIHSKEGLRGSVDGTYTPSEPKVKVIFNKDGGIESVKPDRPEFGDYIEKSANLSPVSAPTGNQSQYEQFRGKVARPNEAPSLEGAQFRVRKPDTTDQYIKELTAKQEEARGVISPVEKLRNTLSNAKSDLVDSLSPIEDRLFKVTQENGDTLTQARLTNQLDRALQSGKLAGQFARDNGLEKIIRNVPNVKEFDQYLIAKHALDLHASGIETGRDINRDAQLLKDLSPAYEAPAKVVKDYSDKMLSYAVDHGLISKDLATHLQEKYPNYVPVNRIFSESEQDLMRPNQTGGRGAASLSKQTVVQRLKGSTREIESPLASLLKNTDTLFNQGERNQAAQMLASFKDLPGNPFNIREVKDGVEPANATFTALHNGKSQRYATDPEIAAAAKSLDHQQLGVVGKILSYPTRLLRLGATGINLPFTISNVIKDQATAFINSNAAAKTSLLNPANFLDALFQSIGHGKLYQEVVREGAGGTSFDIARDNPNLTVDRIRAGKNPLTRIGYTATHPEELIRAAENIIGRSEELTRIQQYKGTYQAAIEQGHAPEDARILASNAARNNTTNFARAGNYGRVLNSVLPYLNAGIQGSRTFVRNMGARPIQTGAKLAVSAFMPMAAATIWNLSDSKRKEAYEDIPDYEKQANIIILPPNPHKDPKTGRWNAIKIPVSQEVANLTNIVRHGVETAYGADPQSLRELAGNLFGSVTSINAGSNRELINQFTPQTIKPGIEIATNQNLYTGNPIIPPQMRNLAPEDQVRKGTSETARKIGGLLHTSPLNIEDIVSTSAGGVGKQVINASDRLLSATGNNRSGVIGGQDIGTAISNKLTSAAGGDTQATNYKDAQKYLKTQRDQALFDAINTTKKAPDGSAIVQPVSNFDQYAVLLNNPNVLSATTIYQKSQSSHDPLWDLPEDKLKAYISLQANPAASSNQKAILLAKLPPDFFDTRNKYFSDLESTGALAKNTATKITTNDKLLALGIEPDTKDNNGSSSAEKYSSYLSEDGFKAFQAKKQLAFQNNGRSDQSGNTQGIDPIYQLPDSYARQVFLARAANNLQIADSSVVKTIKAQPWYKQFTANESQYYKDHPIPTSAQSSQDAYPEMPQDLAKYAAYIKTLPSSSARAQAYNTTQGHQLDNYYFKLDQYNSQKQADLLGTQVNVQAGRFTPSYIRNPGTSPTESGLQPLTLPAYGSTTTSSSGSSVSAALQKSAAHRNARKLNASLRNATGIRKNKVSVPKFKQHKIKGHVKPPTGNLGRVRKPQSA